MKLNELFEPFSVYQLSENVIDMIANEWFLITAGTHAKFNTMTGGWGSFGYLWKMPVVTIFVRPTRYTYEFTENSNLFTICFLEPQFKHILTYCGKYSGRTIDKVRETGLYPLESNLGTVSFAESRLILECKKIYFDDLKEEHFLHPKIIRNYPISDFHRFYVGEILNCWVKKSEAGETDSNPSTASADS